MKTLLLLLSISVAGAAQVPQGVIFTQDVRAMPELSFIGHWIPVTGATAYRVYDAPNPHLDDASCPAILPFDSEVTQPLYADDPIPHWYLIPITNGQWKERTWCYSVSSVVKGIESAKSPAQSITIGNAGYVFLGFVGPGTFSKTDKCLGGAKLPLQSTNLADYEGQLWYVDPANPKVQHFFNTLNIFDGQAYAMIWHTPAVAQDGTIIPWSNSGGYFYRFVYKPLNKSIEGPWNPRGTIVSNYYTQVSANILIDPGQADDGAPCTANYYGNYWPTENITY